ncbi:PTS system mannose/fructose/sorbose family transporter subunit IID [Enterococcus sp. JM9B]|uniref:PTS system mannose/fructose/sorbose family transporter subunit IID n=1 Tax=Enterococcus sp. JM9B TaxID=1857216 RepID=UPI001374A8E5|nr:PTS system mannose/fructose/sorbose family transporter subunit IID [Enterococcus sp. JM9B]KAF1300819.1 hypothetical protein BAU16_11685 [Enterococcus sp. JM9B]
MSKFSIASLASEQKKNMKQLFWRQMFLSYNFTYTKMQGISYGWSMQPVLKRIYKDAPDKYWEAMERGTALYNTTPACSNFIAGMNVSMEEQNAVNPDFDSSVIQPLKLGLMGPLAGIGDTVFQAILRIVATGVSIGLLQAGNPIGLFLWYFIYVTPSILIRWFGQIAGYKLGSEYIAEAAKSGILDIITRAATVMGIMMVGAMSFSMVTIKSTLEKDFGNGQSFVLQDVLDQIVPGLLQLVLVMSIFILLRKKVSPLKILLGVIILGFVLTFLGITG